MCDFRFPFTLKLRLQIWQTNGRSPVWTRLWFSRWSLRGKFFPHIGHRCFLELESSSGKLAPWRMPIGQSETKNKHVCTLISHPNLIDISWYTTFHTHFHVPLSLFITCLKYISWYWISLLKVCSYNCPTVIYHCNMYARTVKWPLCHIHVYHQLLL